MIWAVQRHTAQGRSHTGLLLRLLRHVADHVAYHGHLAVFQEEAFEGAGPHRPGRQEAEEEAIGQVLEVTPTSAPGLGSRLPSAHLPPLPWLLPAHAHPNGWPPRALARRAPCFLQAMSARAREIVRTHYRGRIASAFSGSVPAPWIVKQADDPNRGPILPSPFSHMSNTTVCKFEVKAMDLLYEIFEELRVMFRPYVMSASKRGRHVKQSPMCFSGSTLGPDKRFAGHLMRLLVV